MNKLTTKLNSNWLFFRERKSINVYEIRIIVYVRDWVVDKKRVENSCNVEFMINVLRYFFSDLA